jgi:hypothetical protein
LSITVQLDPGQYQGVPVDWWVIAYANGGWYYLGAQWAAFNGNLAYCHPVHMGPLFNLPATTILNQPVPTGSYTFWFAVDYPMDGILSGLILFDAVNVIATDVTTLLSIWPLGGVENNPTAPSTFTTDAAYQITYINDYHYYNHGALPGTIALRNNNGAVYGPWQTIGMTGQGGVANAYWVTYPNATIPAGTYTVVDSDPSTWSQNAETGHRGVTMVKGVR